MIPQRGCRVRMLFDALAQCMKGRMMLVGVWLGEVEQHLVSSADLPHPHISRAERGAGRSRHSTSR
jgi:hypothetical protein